MIQNIILLDPPDGSLAPLAEAFRVALDDCCLIHVVGTAPELHASLRAGFPYHLGVIDIDRGDGHSEGFKIIQELRNIDSSLPIIAVADQGNVQLASRAVAAGATDLLVRGTDLQDRVSTLLGKVRHLLQLLDEKYALEEQTNRLKESARERNNIIGESPQIRRLADQISRVARVPRPVLIIGERGTGKELVAHAIHEAAGYHDRPMVSVNCAAFADNLLESELFGHERGAFTGADQAVRGKFELADGGTLFLDEIGCMSLPFQQKILRAVEYSVFLRVGGTEEQRTSARIVAATNANLREKTASGEFLQDLYDRLAFEVIEVPPLRDREGDIDLLAQHFLKQFMREIPSMRGKWLTPAAIDALRSYHFPGNVRELKNIVERAAYRDTNNEIVPEELGLPSQTAAIYGTGDFHQRVEAFRHSLIFEALGAAHGNQARAARSLGLAYHQFRYFFKKLDPK